MRAVLFAVVLAAGVAHAQPADPKDLYNAATQAMDEGRYADALRDFQAAYDLTQDPVLFFKIGSAHEQAGDCASALVAYRRYLDEAKPEQQFVDLTNERIGICEAQLAAQQATPAEEPAAPPTPDPAPAMTDPAAAPLPAAPEAPAPSRNKDAAWLFVGGALTFVTAGAVLAYSTSSAEQDLRDLYITFGNLPPEYDDETRERYEKLVDEGERYQLLSTISFGLAGACAAGAAYFFWRASQESDVTIAPVVTPTSAGVSVRF